jgi:hypothetical protein
MTGDKIGPYDDALDDDFPMPESSYEGGTFRTHVPLSPHEAISLVATDEGVIFDLWDSDGECIGTAAWTYVEMYEFIAQREELL